jgi:hypothetical protein
MMDGIAALAFPDTCGSEEHCISVCRDDAIHMAWLPFSGGRSVGKWSENVERATITESTDSRGALE